MGVIELVNESAAVALRHATVLQQHLRIADEAGDAPLEECRDEVHQLVGDIVSLRNAAQLLARQLD